MTDPEGQLTAGVLPVASVFGDHLFLCLGLPFSTPISCRCKQTCPNPGDSPRRSSNGSERCGLSTVCLFEERSCEAGAVIISTFLMENKGSEKFTHFSQDYAASMWWIQGSDHSSLAPKPGLFLFWRHFYPLGPLSFMWAVIFCGASPKLGHAGAVTCPGSPGYSLLQVVWRTTAHPRGSNKHAGGY